MLVFLALASVVFQFEGLAFAAATPAFAAVTPACTPDEVARLERRLRSQVDEAELMIRNERSDRADIELQKRQELMLQVKHLVPDLPEIAKMKELLKRSAKGAGLTWIGFESYPGTESRTRIPPAVFSDQPVFRMPHDQLLVRHRAIVKLEGRREQIHNWVQALDPALASSADQVTRLVEPEWESGGPRRPHLESCGTGCFQLRLSFFSWSSARFPRIVVRDPADYLPACALSDRSLRPWITRVRAVREKAQRVFDIRREFLNRRARLEWLYLKLVRVS